MAPWRSLQTVISTILVDVLLYEFSVKVIFRTAIIMNTLINSSNCREFVFFNDRFIFEMGNSGNLKKELW